jgi:guanylate kinase
MWLKKKGTPVLVHALMCSGPSGAGKSTVLKMLFNEYPGYVLLLSIQRARGRIWRKREC